MEWKKNHYDKAALAGKLAEQGIVSRDVGGLLIELNQARKDVSYGEPGPSLDAIDLEDLASDLETFIDEVEKIVDEIEEDSE